MRNWYNIYRIKAYIIVCDGNETSDKQETTQHNTSKSSHSEARKGSIFLSLGPKKHSGLVHRIPDTDLREKWLRELPPVPHSRVRA